MIRTQVPGRDREGAVSPAGTSPRTGRVTGAPGVAAATSAAWTAYPSMAELSNGGQRRSRGDVLGEHAAVGLVQPQPDRWQRPDRREHLGEVGLDRHQRCPVSALITRPSRYLRSQGTNSGAMSGRSHANWIWVRR